MLGRRPTLTDMPQSSRIVLVLGGTRSGKSEVAERIACAPGLPVAYLATGSGDSEGMDARIERHRSRRPADWTTVECGPQLVAALDAHPAGTVLVDSLGTWLAAHHDFDADTGVLLDALRRRSGLTVIVSEEVGLSVHPTTDLGRRFVDAMGDLNQAVASLAHDVALVVAGRTLWLPAEADEAGPR